MKKNIPSFKNETEELALWQPHDLTEYIAWPKGKNMVFNNLKPNDRALPESIHKSLTGKE